MSTLQSFRNRVTQVLSLISALRTTTVKVFRRIMSFHMYSSTLRVPKGMCSRNKGFLDYEKLRTKAHGPIAGTRNEDYNIDGA